MACCITTKIENNFKQVPDSGLSCIIVFALKIGAAEAMI